MGGPTFTPGAWRQIDGTDNLFQPSSKTTYQACIVIQTVSHIPTAERPFRSVPSQPVVKLLGYSCSSFETSISIPRFPVWSLSRQRTAKWTQAWPKLTRSFPTYESRNRAKSSRICTQEILFSGALLPTLPPAHLLRHSNECQMNDSDQFRSQTHSP